MSSIGIITVVGLAVIVILAVFFVKNRANDQLKEIMTRRKASSKLVSRAEYVEGMEHIPVAISLSDSAVFYENADLQAQLDLSRIDEVEYDNELAFGKEVPEGKVLRLRSHGQAFEFILDNSSAQQWLSSLPAHRMDEPGSVRAV